MIKTLLGWIDRSTFAWLMRHPDRVPPRFVKWIAWHYPDARVRKLYWGKLNVFMGEGTFPNPGLLVVNTMDFDSRVTIGSNVSIAPGVILITDSSPGNSCELMSNPVVLTRLTKRAAITIDDDVWIGAGAIVLPGICIGKCAVIGAGSIVTGDVEAGMVVAGTPARPTRSIFDNTREKNDE